MNTFDFYSVVKQELSLVQMLLQYLGLFLVISLMFKKAAKNLKNKEKWIRIVNFTFFSGLFVVIPVLVYIEIKMVRIYKVFYDCLD